jgi:hypothetical protein
LQFDRLDDWRIVVLGPIALAGCLTVRSVAKIGSYHTRATSAIRSRPAAIFT